ncbi:hypothetical protein RH858_06785 [Halalkaliarchaeum sp. AArc-GB]|nr:MULTISPECIES: hypothetical protein [unclassified Halalkaliarchaeum]MDR5672854.1 hypothetical protein [Halalkaliarchaeum sp. AArc-GB]
MSVSGVCQICESRPGRHTCRLCGQFVCEEHFRTMEAICTDCAAGATQ